MKSILRLYLRFLQLDVEYMLQYRKSTILELLYYILEMSAWIVFWRVIFSRVTILGDWTFEETLILVGMGTTMLGLWASFFIAPAILEYLILDGNTLEKYLVRPVPTFWGLLGERFQPHKTGEQLFSGIILILIVTVSSGTIQPSPINMVLAAFILLMGTLILTLMLGTFNCLAFWIPRPGMSDILDNFFEFAWIPLDRMPARLRLFLTWGMPIMIMTTIPARVYLGKASLVELGGYLMAAFSLLLFWGGMFTVFWRKGLKNFQSWRG